MNRFLLSNLCILTIAGGLSGRVCLAAEADVSLRIERVALFKNGLGHFTSTAKLPRDASTIRFGQMPLPSHGTFWAIHDSDVPVKGLFTSLEDTTQTEPIRSVADFIAANVGKTVTIETHNQNSKPITGKLLSVTRAIAPRQPSPYVMSPRPDERNRRGYATNAVLAMIRTDQGVVALDVNRIVQCSIAGDAIQAEHAVTSRTPVLHMELTRPAGGKQVWIDYLARGITWAPSYRIDLTNDKTARLTAKAVVINEVADLDNVKLELVTGFPNLSFADVNSPVGLSQTLEQFMKALQRGRSESTGRGRRNVVAQQRVMSNVASWAAPGMPVADYSTMRQGQHAEDLFLYPLDKITIKKGETATLPLFTLSVPYQHVYTWIIPDSLDEQGRQLRRDEAPQDEEEVWHSCRFTNGKKMPLTTAPAQFVKHGRIVGQDICYYTNPGSVATVRINRALRIVAAQAEYETNRKRNATNFFGYTYDLVQVRGELKLRSALAKDAQVEVTKMLSGKVLDSSGAPDVTAIAKGLKSVNTRHRLLWKMNLKAGKDTTLTYSYEVYVRR
jgi:hypothetical protein